MKHIGARTILAVCYMLLLCIAYSCSDNLNSYKELEETGKLETTVRKQYKQFFSAIASLTDAASKSDGAIDSTTVSKAASATDAVIADIMDFPTTLDSRIAYDALVYGAVDLVTSPTHEHPDIWNFWQNGLLPPLFSSGKHFIGTENNNELAHLQLIKGLQKAMGGMADESMVLASMTVIGVAPSQMVLSFCDADTFVFKNIHDLILYSRSLQETDPPLWLLSGDWLFAIQYDGGQPPIFLVVSPHFADELAYLAFSVYSLGELYASVFDDPIPTDVDTWETWYVRADAVMQNLIVDGDFATRVEESDLSSLDAHYFYDDYLIRTDADSVSKEIAISFVRRKVQSNDFEYIGGDSIAVTFKDDQILTSFGPVTEVAATREMGSSLVGGELYPQEQYTGTAYVMAIGKHNPDVVIAYRDQLINMMGPDISISTEAPSAPNAAPQQ